MRFSFLLLAGLLVGLTACGGGPKIRPAELPLLHFGEPGKVWVNRDGQRLLTGLIALRADDAGLYYVVLEAGGLTLIEALLARNGERQVVQAKPGIVESGLADLLGDALSRLLLVGASQPSCEGLLPRICRQQQGQVLYVKAGLAGLTLWQGEIRYDAKGGAERLRYQQSLAGMEVIIEQ